MYGAMMSIATQRLALWGFPSDIIHDFSNFGLSLCCFNGRFIKLDPNQMRVLRYIESKYNCCVYAVIRNVTPAGNVDSYLYVSPAGDGVSFDMDLSTGVHVVSVYEHRVVRSSSPNMNKVVKNMARGMDPQTAYNRGKSDRDDVRLVKAHIKRVPGAGLIRVR